VVLLDACCLLNLYASGRLGEILTALPFRFAVAEAVVAEALYVIRKGSGSQPDEKVPVELQPLFDRGVIERWQLETDDEASLHIAFAEKIDDGEAMTCALAVKRNACVASDDAKPIRILRERAPEVPRYSTLNILKAWADILAVPTSEIQAMLDTIGASAVYRPRANDPLYSWWKSISSSKTP
jgi:hypothetical protein